MHSWGTSPPLDGPFRHGPFRPPRHGPLRRGAGASGWDEGASPVAPHRVSAGAKIAAGPATGSGDTSWVLGLGS